MIPNSPVTNNYVRQDRSQSSQKTHTKNTTRHPNLAPSSQNVTDTEVGALLSADMRDERYYEKKLQAAQAQKS